MLALAVALAIVLANFASYALTAIRAIGFPYNFDYGEGIVWQQMRLILDGRGYAPIDGFPAIVFHYPPGFHLATALLSSVTGMDELAAGRSVSVISMLVTAGFVAAAVMRLAREEVGFKPGLICALLAGGVVFTLYPVQLFAFLMRVDMMSFAFGFAGFTCGLLALTRPNAVFAAAILFVAAVYTKQTALAAPVSVFLVLLLVRPRTAWTGIATILTLGLFALAMVSWLTDGGFLRHIVTYNINRFDWVNAAMIRRVFQLHGIYIAIALFGIAAWAQRLPWRDIRGGGWHNLRERLRSSPATAGRIMAVIYLVLTTLMLVGALKSGAAVNYFIEWGCVVAMWVGLAQVEAMVFAGSASARRRRWAIMIPALIAIQALLLFGKADARYAPDVTRPDGAARLVALVRAAPQPVIGDDMVAILRGGKPVLWEPAIFAELAALRVWDERPFVAKIEAGEFGFFITVGNPGDWLFNSRYSPAVTKAIVTAYPTTRHLDGYTLRFPAGPLPDYAAELR